MDFSPRLCVSAVRFPLDWFEKIVLHIHAGLGVG
jgi:hypothetical protein